MRPIAYFRRVGRAAVRASPVLLASVAFILVGGHFSIGAWHGWGYFVQIATTFLMIAILLFCTATAAVQAYVDVTGVSTR